jgi:hypothetical protein
LWNPADFNANFTLSGGNKIAVRAGPDGWVSGRADHSFASGKKYFGVLIGGAGADAGLMIGWSEAAATLANYVGFDTHGWGFNSNAGDTYASGAGPFAYGGAWGGGAHIGAAIDFGAQKMWWAINNVWQNSGNPAAGTGWAFTSFGALTLFPTISGYFGAGTHNFTLQANATDSTYAPPSGFSMIGV